MSSFYQRCAAFLFTGILSLGANAYVLDIEANSVEAQAWIIYDPQSQQIISASQENQIRAPASLTKMMVGYLALHALEQGKLRLDQVVTVPEVVTTVQADESRLKLKPHQQITVQELIAALTIMSANDAALTLATLISGDIPPFIELMNQTAQQLGMSNTRFSNPSGITMPDHYSTAYDLALLAQAIVSKTPQYLDYSKQQEFHYKDISHVATNLLLKRDPSVDGLKTGYTQAAGYNLALTAERFDSTTFVPRRLIVIVLGTANKYKRADVAHSLLNIGFNYTQNQSLNLTEKIIAEIPIHNGKVPSYDIKVSNTFNINTFSLLEAPHIALDAKKYDPLLHRFVIQKQPLQLLEPLSQPKSISYSVDLLERALNAPLPQSQIALAKINIKQFEKVIHHLDIEESVELEEATWWQKLVTWFKSWMTGVNTQMQPVIYPIASQ